MTSRDHDSRSSNSPTAPSRKTILDVRWQLSVGAQPDLYAAGHIPGAVFADLDRDLAAPPGPGGRHPLPAAEKFERAMRAAGVSDDALVVVYDDAGGLPAARAWWLLRYFGHPEVALLDGGLEAWLAAGRPLAEGDETPAHLGDFTARAGGMPVINAQQAGELAATGVLIDARAPERYRGESEPMDPVAGHIPGARNSPRDRNLDASGRFLGPAELAEALADLTGPGRLSAPTAAPGSPRHTRCWHWRWRDYPAPRCTPAPGASGSLTPPARSPPATSPRRGRAQSQTRPRYDDG